MTPAEQIESQFGSPEIVCPFCDGKNQDDGTTVTGNPLCCDKFVRSLLAVITQTSGEHALYPARVAQAIEIISALKVKEIENQIREAQIGMRDTLICPYCSESMEMGQMDFCCDQMTQATAAVLDRMETQERLDHAAKVADRAAR